MKPLDEHESWKLLCKIAFKQDYCPYPELESAGKKIAGLCRGLPLSTVVIGGLLLKSPRSLQFWENVARNIQSNHDSKEKQESLDVLSLSYNHLPPHLKPCFLYMGVFKEDSRIRVSKIIKLWLAEGLIRPSNNHILEEIAEGFLKELIDRNLILIRKHRKKGKIGYCGVHDLLRDMCLKVGGEQEFFRMHNDDEVFGCSRGPSLASSVFRIAESKLVRVWKVGCFHKFDEEQLVFSNVCYLCFTCLILDQPLWKIPSSVSLMWNLQSLIIHDKSSHKAVVAPVEFWRMQQLRHFECPNLHLPSPPSPDDGLFVMDNLLTLMRTHNFKMSEQVYEIVPNIKKLQMEFDQNLQGYDDSLIECLHNLDCLHKLARSIFGTLSTGIAEHRLLRVWDELHHVSRPEEFFSSNVNVRYLHFTFEIFGPSMKRKIPSSVSLVWNLQTITMHSGYTLNGAVVAMIEFWKMRQLRHVKCPKIDLPHPPSPSNGVFMMDNLQTLTTPLNLRLSEEVCQILPNIKKLCMVYDSDRQGYDDSLIECLRNLDCLHKLESLNLGFGIKRTMYAQLNKRVRLPNLLNKLTLESCELGCEDICMIGSLPRLQVLQLRNVEYNTKEWSPIAGQFLHLKYLYVESYSLRYWYADKSHFPVLEKLFLSGLWELKEIPLSMGEIPTLELIRVLCCSESAATSAVRIKEDQLENHENDALQIQVTMYAVKAMESFKERVEREGLSINGILLELDRMGSFGGLYLSRFHIYIRCVS